VAGTGFAADWTPLHKLVALGSAPNVDELHRRLVLLPAADGNPADAFEPLRLLRKFHDDEQQGATTTAMLLVTDARWRHATGRLINAIASSGCVPDEDLEVLAQAFLAAGPRLYWEAPAEWFAGGFEIELDGAPCVVVEPPSVERSAADDDGPVVVEREVRPPLRRWAAERSVRSDPASWSKVLRRAHQLDARASAAVMRGLLDALGVLTPSAQTWLRKLATQWPNRDVRAAAEAVGEKQPSPPQAHRDSGPPPRRTTKTPREQPTLF
jgi:hypothetical protein